MWKVEQMVGLLLNVVGFVGRLVLWINRILMQPMAFVRIFSLALFAHQRSIHTALIAYVAMSTTVGIIRGQFPALDADTYDSLGRFLAKLSDRSLTRIELPSEWIEEIGRTAKEYHLPLATPPIKAYHVSPAQHLIRKSFPKAHGVAWIFTTDAFEADNPHRMFFFLHEIGHVSYAAVEAKIRIWATPFSFACYIGALFLSSWTWISTLTFTVLATMTWSQLAYLRSGIYLELAADNYALRRLPLQDSRAVCLARANSLRNKLRDRESRIALMTATLRLWATFGGRVDDVLANKQRLDNFEYNARYLSLPHAEPDVISELPGDGISLLPVLAAAGAVYLGLHSVAPPWYVSVGILIIYTIVQGMDNVSEASYRAAHRVKPLFDAKLVEPEGD
jgi:hypothetical protein